MTDTERELRRLQDLRVHRPLTEREALTIAEHLVPKMLLEITARRSPALIEQSTPRAGVERPTWELVMEDMRERDHLGREKYGVALQSDNGRDHLVDAYQEALDLTVYLRAAIERRRRELQERDPRALREKVDAVLASMRKDGEGLNLSQEQKVLAAIA